VDPRNPGNPVSRLHHQLNYHPLTINRQQWTLNDLQDNLYEEVLYFINGLEFHK